MLGTQPSALQEGQVRLPAEPSSLQSLLVLAFTRSLGSVRVAMLSPKALRNPLSLVCILSHGVYDSVKGPGEVTP